jgi:hypothetical protein
VSPREDAVRPYRVAAGELMPEEVVILVEEAS